jgi:hypothetical protein
LNRGSNRLARITGRGAGLALALLLTVGSACNRTDQPAGTERGAPPAAGTSGSARGQEGAQEAEAAVTLTGCLERDRRRTIGFKLVTTGQLGTSGGGRSEASRSGEEEVAPDQDVFGLVAGPGVDLGRHVGHRITITGSMMAAATADTARRGTKGSDETEARTLRVTSLDKVSAETCHAGGRKRR